MYCLKPCKCVLKAWPDAYPVSSTHIVVKVTVKAIMVRYIFELILTKLSQTTIAAFNSKLVIHTVMLSFVLEYRNTKLLVGSDNIYLFHYSVVHFKIYFMG